MNPIYFSTEFECSSDKVQICPPSEAEVAFAGRSNAGKSSAINTITRNNKLARIGKTPGRTQLINHFLVSEGHYLVDLPGYGYAAVSKAKQKVWQSAMFNYLTRRESLQGLVVVMDIRRPLQDSDWHMIDIQQQSAADLHVLLTKSDKVSKNIARSTLMQVSGELERAGIEATVQDFSALKEQGVDDCHAVLDCWLFNKPLPV